MQGTYIMDKLLREKTTSDITENTQFANLGAPRERYFDEYTPSAKQEISQSQTVQSSQEKPHFKLIPSTLFLKNSNSSISSTAVYTVLALLVGISVTSFLTQSVLAVKDVVFGPSEVDVQIAQNADVLISTANTVLGSSQNNNQEPLGSDDGGTRTSMASASTVGQFNGTNQYQLANETSFPKLSSRSYLAADLQTGEIILEQNEDLIAPIASVTKLMTALIAKETMNLQKIAIVSRDSYNTYGAQGDLKLGEKIKVYDLMYPLLMESSNDAAEVIADAHDKGHEAFLSLMNKKAVELGMNDTYYEDPSGLNPKNVSSIRDLLKLGMYVHQKHPDLYEMTRVRQYAILKHTWFNQNRFLNYDSFLGGKNGYIDEAKKTTVSLFDVPMARGGKRQVAIVLLKSDDREGDAVKIINFLKKNAFYQEIPGVN